MKFLVCFLSTLTMQRAFAFVSRQAARSQQRPISTSLLRFAEEGQAEVVLVGCGAPNRGMGWYHAVGLTRFSSFQKEHFAKFKKWARGILSHPWASSSNSFCLSCRSKCLKRSKFVFVVLLFGYQMACGFATR